MMGQHDRSAGEIGVISSVTQAFCGECNRARLSTEGQLYLCLFAEQGYDLRSLVRGTASDADLGIGHCPHLAGSHHAIRIAQCPAIQEFRLGGWR